MFAFMRETPESEAPDHHDRREPWPDLHQVLAATKTAATTFQEQVHDWFGTDGIIVKHLDDALAPFLAPEKPFSETVKKSAQTNEPTINVNVNAAAPEWPERVALKTRMGEQLSTLYDQAIGAGDFGVALKALELRLVHNI